MMDMALPSFKRRYWGVGVAERTPRPGKARPDDAKTFSHISPNATGLQLQVNGRAGRGSEFVSENHPFFEFGLLADFQIFVMVNIGRFAHLTAYFGTILADYYDLSKCFK